MSTLRWLRPTSSGVSLDLHGSPSSDFRRAWGLLCEGVGAAGHDEIPWQALLGAEADPEEDLSEVADLVLDTARLGRPIRPQITLAANGTLTDRDFRYRPAARLSSGEQLQLNRLGCRS